MPFPQSSEIITLDQGLAAGVYGQLVIPSDGSDGAFAPVANIEVDLSLAADATWDTPAPVAGQGVYDGEKWAVVFKYTTVDIPSGVTVTFKNHPKRAAVVWLVQGDVIIGGAVNLDGQDDTGWTAVPAESGPGGFRGGRAKVSPQGIGSGGYGPGGARYDATEEYWGGGGSHQTTGEGVLAGRTYGNGPIVPLIGGSGGGGSTESVFFGAGGGAGGGAILIAAGNTITVDGYVSARGGSKDDYYGAGGSGGAIRLVADTVNGIGSLTAAGGSGWRDGGMGRIRIEADSVTLSSIDPSPSLSPPDDPPLIWPGIDAPAVRATQLTYIDGEGIPQVVPVPDDPGASLAFPLADVSFQTDDAVTLDIETTNIPTDWELTVRVVPITGDTQEVIAVHQSGDEILSTWSATLTLSSGFSAIQIRADQPAGP